MGNVLLDEIEKRKRNIDEYNAKSQKVAALREQAADIAKEIATIDNDLANTDPAVLQGEIDYLTAVAIREGVIAPEVSASNEDACVDDTAPTVETVAENPQIF